MTTDAPNANGRPGNAIQDLPVFIKELAAGGAAGALGKTSVAPLERVKILVQTERIASSRITDVLRYIYDTNGISGMFRGNGASVCRVVPYAAFHFYTYEHYRAALVRVLLPSPQHKVQGVPPWIDLLAGSCAGATAVSITYPLDLGMAPTLVGILPYAGLKFYVYQSLKGSWHSRHQGSSPPGKPPAHITLLCGGAAGLVAQTLTYPLDVVRRKMQVVGVNSDQKRPSMYQMYSSIVHRHGWRGLFHGVHINYWKVGPSTAVGFTVYDHMKSLLGLRNNL